MGSVVELYEALASAQVERTRARVIAEDFERLEECYPHLSDLGSVDVSAKSSNKQSLTSFTSSGNQLFQKDFFPYVNRT